MYKCTWNVSQKFGYFFPIKETSHAFCRLILKSTFNDSGLSTYYFISTRDRNFGLYKK